MKTVKLLFCLATLWLGLSSGTVAQPTETNPPNPLELDTTGDPLLPNPPVERPLSPLERRRLKQDLDQLNNQAAAELRAGNLNEAFEIWYREIRLRRVLGGRLEEVKTLGRVGEIAWSRNAKFQVQLIAKRLEKIQQDAEQSGSLDPELLQALGQAYRQTRVPRNALVIYEKILANSRQQGDVETQAETLETMAQLHLAWFEYPEAATIYEELLVIANTRGDSVAEIKYLQELLNIYEQYQEPDDALRLKALGIKERLVDSYLNQEDYTQIPALKIAMGADYEALKQPDQASQSYQEAYKLALSSQQFADASDALEKLAQLYLSYDQPDYAIQVYEILIIVEQQSYNYYGLMQTYDKMGEIYLAQNKYAQALDSFQKGLALAQSLEYQETHFDRQIEKVNQEEAGMTIDN